MDRRMLERVVFVIGLIILAIIAMRPFDRPRSGWVNASEAALNIRVLRPETLARGAVILDQDTGDIWEYSLKLDTPPEYRGRMIAPGRPVTR
jgi:hypothetical protein